LFSSGEIFSGGLDVFVFVWQGQGFLEYSPAATHPSIDVFAAHLFGCYLPSTTSVCLSLKACRGASQPFHPVLSAGGLRCLTFLNIFSDEEGAATA
jgi:hypothetical protein